MKSKTLSLSSAALVATMMLGPSMTYGQEIRNIQGIITITCGNGTCAFSEDCLNLDMVPGTLVSNSTMIEYTDIQGDFRLEPVECEAACMDCLPIPGSDQDEGGCIGSAGYVYCPETDDCIRPWENNCPLEGTKFVGPTEITCTVGGRCNSISGACDFSIGSMTIGGFYLTGLLGNYTLPDGCEVICQECDCDDCTFDLNTTSTEPTDSPSNGDGNNTSDESTEPPLDAGAMTRNAFWSMAVFLGYSTLMLL